MIWKQYTYAALVGACIAFGVIIASRIGDSGLGTAHVIVGCILTAIISVKTTKVADSKR
jgi:threonine/homoserine efflux transporter RhtA